MTFSALSGDAQQKYIGARIGANLGNESPFFSGPFQGINTGFIAGGQFDYWFDNRWSVSAQVLFDQKGSKRSSGESGTDFSESGTTEFILNYLEIPIFYKVALVTGNIRPYVFAGPSIGFFLSGSQKINSRYLVNTHSTTIDTTMTFNDSIARYPDISAVLGAGISINLRTGQLLFLDAAYALGLVNIWNNPKSSSPVSLNSRDIRLTAGILFPMN